MVTADYSAVFLRRAREMDFRRAFAAVSFAVRFSPEIGLFAVVLFGLCRSPICFATAGFVPAFDPSDPAGSGFVVVAAAAVAVVAAAVDFFDLFAAVLFVVVVSVFAVFLVFPFCFAWSVGVVLWKWMVAAVPFSSLTHQSSS